MQELKLVPLDKPAPSSSKDKGTWRKIAEYAKSQGFEPGSGFATGGHNVGSKHYSGEALDVRIRGKTKEQIEAFIASASAAGYKVRDERSRPKGQKVWGGPHLHLTMGDGGDGYDDPFAKYQAEKPQSLAPYKDPFAKYKQEMSDYRPGQYSGGKAQAPQTVKQTAKKTAPVKGVYQDRPASKGPIPMAAPENEGRGLVSSFLESVSAIGGPLGLAAKKGAEITKGVDYGKAAKGAVVDASKDIKQLNEAVEPTLKKGRKFVAQTATAIASPGVKPMEGGFSAARALGKGVEALDPTQLLGVGGVLADLDKQTGGKGDGGKALVNGAMKFLARPVAPTLMFALGIDEELTRKAAGGDGAAMEDLVGRLFAGVAGTVPAAKLAGALRSKNAGAAVEKLVTQAAMRADEAKSLGLVNPALGRAPVDLNPVSKFLNDVEASTRPPDMSPKPGIGGQVGATYERGLKYHQPIPEVKSLNPNRLTNLNTDKEVSRVSDEVARNMDFSTPVEASVFADGTIGIIDGHHRVAAAKQLGLGSIPVKLRGINAKGDVIQSLVNESESLVGIGATRKQVAEHVKSADTPPPTDPPISAQGQGGGKVPTEFPKVINKTQMLRRGADGHLDHAVEMDIPVGKITGREPTPADWVDDAGEVREFKPGQKITNPVEVRYDRDADDFVLYAGNHRLRQSEVNGDAFIRAFVEADDYSDLAAKYGKSTTPPQSTGIANAVQDAEAGAGQIPDSPRATGTKKGDAHSQGKAAVESGDIDPYELARDIAEGKRTFKDETEVGALIEGKRRLLVRAENARKALDDAIASRGDTATAAKEYALAQSDLNEFVQNVQKGKGKWSDVGRALQEGTTVDLGNFDDVLAEARRIKEGDLSTRERGALKKEFDRVNAELQKANARLAELEAAQVIERNRATKRMRRTGDIAQDIQSAKKELLAAASKAGANPIVDPEIWAAFGKLVKYEIEAGASKLEDLVLLMRGHLQEAGINATDEDIKRAIGQVDKPESTPRTRSDAEKLLTELRKEARATSQIEELEKNLREGVYPEKAPPRQKGDAEIEKLKAHKRLLENQLQRRIRAGQPVRTGNKILRGVGSATGVGRMAALGADFGAILRQAMFANPIVAPRKFAAGAKSALKGIRSEADLLVLEEASQLAKAPDGTMLEPIRRRHNLSRASVMGDKEEGYIIKAADWLLQNTIGRIPGLKNVGGSLGRGQQAWLNTVRDKMFDDFYIKHPDATPKELDDWAAYINSAFGRSSSYGANRSPGEMAQAFLTSPRYEASRWEMAGNYLASLFTLGKAFKDRAARAKLVNMIGTASTVAATLKIAEISSGGEMDWDPFSSDFLKLRLEDGTVIDATAGISPRLRTLIRIGLYVQNPEAYTKYTKPTEKEASRPYKRSEILPKEIMSGVTRPISPGVTGPIEERTGYGLSGWQEDDGEPQGWWRLAPLIVQGLKQDLDAKGPMVAARNAALEFFGLSTQRYPKPAK